MRLEEIIQEIGEQHNVSPEEVRAEMEAAMLHAFHNQSPEAHRLWEAIAPEGTPPTLERLVFCLAVLAASGRAE